MTALFDTCIMLFFDRNCSSISPIQWCIRRFVVRHPHPSACSSFAKLAAYLIVLSTSLPLPLNCCTRSFPCVCVCVYERVHESLHILIPYEIKKGVSPLLPFFLTDYGRILPTQWFGIPNLFSPSSGYCRLCNWWKDPTLCRSGKDHFQLETFHHGA